MLNMEFTHIIQLIVNRELNDPNLPKIQFLNNCSKIPGICATLLLDARYKYKVLQKKVRLAFCGNVSVFFSDSVNEDNILKPLKKLTENDWINTSNHNTCWLSDGLMPINELYFKMCEEIAPGPQKVNFNIMFGEIISKYPENVWMYIKETNEGRKLIKIEKRD